jgi:TRAP-type C4-dicarboxylate transport system permease small subunit
MNGFFQMIFRLSRGANILAGITLTLIMLITVTDVILRSLGRPIVGIFELVAFLGAIVIGFSLPFTSWVRGHIYVDFFVMKLPPKGRTPIHIATRCMGVGLFLLIGWNLIKMGVDLSRSGEVSATLQLPFYSIVYGLGAACLLECLVLFGDIVKVLRGQYE